MSAMAHTITLAGIDADIVEAKRFLADELAAIVVHLKKGADTREAEKRLQDSRVNLELLRTLRRQHVRAGINTASARRSEARPC
jgi:hypothetical protein